MRVVVSERGEPCSCARGGSEPHGLVTQPLTPSSTRRLHKPYPQEKKRRDKSPANYRTTTPQPRARAGPRRTPAASHSRSPGPASVRPAAARADALPRPRSSRLPRNRGRRRTASASSRRRRCWAGASPASRGGARGARRRSARARGAPPGAGLLILCAAWLCTEIWGRAARPPSRAPLRNPPWVVDGLGAAAPALLRASRFPRGKSQRAANLTEQGLFETPSSRPCVKGSSARPTGGPAVPAWPSYFGGLVPLLYELVQLVDAGICVRRRTVYRSRLHSLRLHRTWRPLMSPPRDTAGSAAPRQAQQPADAGHNQKSTTFRNGTTEEGWFYPTPAALKAAADVRGTRAARESCCLRSIRRPRAQATPRPTTRTSSSIPITRTAWCTASEGARVPPRLTCVCDPQRS